MIKNTKNRDELLEALSASMDDSCTDRQELSDLFDRIQQSSPIATELKQKFESYHLVRDAMHNDLSAACTPDFSARVSAAIANEPPIVSAAAGGRSLNRGADVNYATPVATQQDIDKVASQPESEYAPVELSGYREEKSKAKKSAGNVFGAGIGGLAVAASAALIALVGFNVLDQSGLNGAPTGTEVAATATDNTNDVVTPVVINQIATNASASDAATGSTAGRALVNSLQVAPVEFVSNTTTFWVRDGKSGTAARNPANEKRLNKLLTRHFENSPTARIGGILPYARIVGYDTTPAADDSQKEQQDQ